MSTNSLKEIQEMIDKGMEEQTQQAFTQQAFTTYTAPLGNMWGSAPSTTPVPQATAGQMFGQAFATTTSYPYFSGVSDEGRRKKRETDDRSMKLILRTFLDNLNFMGVKA